MLSGGLDSSSIVCVARRLLREHHLAPLHTFSAIFPDVPQCDEQRYIAALVSEGDVEPHYVRGDLLSPLVDIDRVLAHEDEPFYAPNLFLHWELYRAAQAAGVRVVCDGVDGDTTVSHGLLRLAELAASGRWPTLAAESFALSRRLQQSPWRLLWRNALRPFLPQRVRATWRLLRGRSPLINRAFADRTGLAQRLRALDPERAPPPRTARQEHWRRLTSGLVPFALEIADKAAAAFAIEPRYPFFDRRLAEYCLALPSDQKLRSGFTQHDQARGRDAGLPFRTRPTERRAIPWNKRRKSARRTPANRHQWRRSTSIAAQSSRFTDRLRRLRRASTLVPATGSTVPRDETAVAGTVNGPVRRNVQGLRPPGAVRAGPAGAGARRRRTRG